MLILIFGLWLRWMPISGHQGVAALILPTATLALPQMGILARLMRTEMLEVLSGDYIKTTHAKGHHPRWVTWWVTYRHALRNALISGGTLDLSYLSQENDCVFTGNPLGAADERIVCAI